MEAENILRKFYGLPLAGAVEPQAPKQSGIVIDLTDFWGE